LDRRRTSDALNADARNFFKVEQWTADGLHVARMLYAGNSLDVFDAAIRFDPFVRYLNRTQSVDKLALELQEPFCYDQHFLTPDSGASPF